MNLSPQVNSPSHHTGPWFSNQGGDVGLAPSPEPWVLVVDDDPLGGRATSRLVSSLTGLAVRCSSTPEHAVCGLAGASKPVALIVDFELAEQANGVELLCQVRATGCDAPAVILTGAPHAAMRALFESRLVDAIPILTRGDHHSFLRSWLEPLSVCWVASA